MRNGYARTETKSVPMHDPICAAKVAEHLAAHCAISAVNAGALIEERCGRYTRGAHAGQLRGWAEIEVVVMGGWKKDGPGYGNGHVVRPGVVLGIRIADYSGKLYLEVR